MVSEVALEQLQREKGERQYTFLLTSFHLLLFLLKVVHKD